MTGFFKKLAKTLGLAEDPFPQKKDINPAEVYFKPFEELRALLVSWIEESRPQYAERQDYNPEKLGFELHDMGGSADVYVSPCKRFAIRVSRELWDYGYQHYLDIVLQRQNNPYFPKVYAVLQEGNRQVVLLEYLQAIDFDDPEYDEVDVIREDARVGKTGNPCPHMQELVRDLHGLLSGGVCRNDLYGDNALLRRTGNGVQLVITDPVA